MNRAKRMIALLLAALLGIAAAQVPGSTLIVGMTTLPNTIDSADATASGSIGVTRQIVDRLVELGESELGPGLALRWEANEDSTAWTFYLREGVSFHDGAPFNAEAVKFSLDRWNDRGNPYHFASDGKAYVGWRNLFGGFLNDGSALDEVTVVDEYTVRLDLNRSISFLPSLLAAGYFGFDSPAAVIAAGANYGTPAVGSVGTGPYRFEQWQEGSRLVLSANSDYWGGAPQTEQIVFVGVGDQTARLAQLKAGAIDIASDLAPSDLPSINADPSIEAILGSGGLNTSYLAMHQNQPPFDNVLVRRAVAHAIDRQAIVDAFYAGQAVLARDIIPAVLWGHGDYEAYAYDPELSRDLLAQAGYPDGFSTELWFRSSGLEPVIAEVIASYLADVGIQAAVKTEDWASYLANYMAGNFPMYTLGWNADFPDPDTFVYTFYGPPAVRRFGLERPDVVALVERAREVPSQAEREALYAQALTEIHDEVPMLTLAHESKFLVVRTGVEGVVMNPLGGFPRLNNATKASN